MIEIRIACTAEALRARTKAFAVRVVKLVQALPNTDEARILGRQLLRAGTSVAANYRAACRGRSRAEFVAKLGIVAEEADEVVLWLELLTETEVLSGTQVESLLREANELAAIMSSSRRTARSNHQITKSPNYQMTKSPNR